jgi:hypothetical protein
MSNPEQVPDIIYNPSVEDIARFARLSYLHEPGTKQAVDSGVITMRELEITHYLNAWTNENAPDIGDSEKGEMAWMTKLEEACAVVAELYSIDINEARRIFEKVSKIPRAGKK